MKLLDGRGRKVAIPVLLVSAVGWLVFIVSFGWLNDNLYGEGTTLGNGDNFGRLHERWFPFWGFAIGTPAFFVLALPHLIFGQWYIGVLSNFCAAFLLLSGGGVLYIDGEIIREFNERFSTQLTETEAGRYLVGEFAGCLMAVLFVVVYMLTWPFYTDVNNYECVGYQSPRNRRLAQIQTTQDYPSTYVPVSAQSGIAMQQVYSASGAVPAQGVVYPASGAVPPQGVVYPVSNAAPISVPKQE